MKLSFKTWCIKNNYNWYGQGKIGNFPYDWCVNLDLGRKAMFSSRVSGLSPVPIQLRNRTVLLFPNIKNSILGDQVSKTRFDHFITWVKKCLDGEIEDYKIE